MNIVHPDVPLTSGYHGAKLSATAVHSHGDGLCLDPVAADRPPEIRCIYVLPLEPANLRDGHTRECDHKGDFPFRISRNLQEPLQLIEREHVLWFANDAGQNDNERWILSKEGAGLGRIRE